MRPPLSTFSYAENVWVTRYQICYRPSPPLQGLQRLGLTEWLVPLSVLADPTGLEPVTYSLEGCCSIQLSQGTYSL